MDTDTKKIKILASIMKENGLKELYIKESGFELKLTRENDGSDYINSEFNSSGNDLTAAEKPKPYSQINENITNTISQIKTPADKNSGVKNISGRYEIKSPMIGVFYSSPSPEAEPFVKIGSRVKTGDILCIVEAMKLMNDITADRDGEIVDICAQNGDIVEYGQTLFRIV